MKDKILVIDDDPGVLRSQKKLLEIKGYEVETLENPIKVKDLLREVEYNCILLDIGLPGISGLELLPYIRENYPDIPVIILSGQGTIKIAVETIKMGAFDYIEKNSDPERLLVTIKNAIQQQDLRTENRILNQELEENYKMVGKSPVFFKLLDDIKIVAKTPAKVLIEGESGTGKELVAWAIHHNSPRKGKPYIKLNCAAIPSELLESELFGFTRGAFTHAISDKKGKFHEADGGTIFLDEIGDLSLNLQAKILRVLQEGEIDVIGENYSRKVDVRVIAATNKDIEKLIREGKFREDLYHRLNVFKLYISPLHTRIEDILPLAYYFLNKKTAEYNKHISGFNKQVESYLVSYSWPGNVRELQNSIEKLVVYTKSNIINMADIQKAFNNYRNSDNEIENLVSENGIIELKDAIENFKKQYIIQALEQMGWKKSETARILGIERTNLFKKMKALGLD